MPKTNKQLERELKYKLSKCRKCPFLEIRDLHNEKVYCFYQLGHICVLDLVEEMRGNNGNSKNQHK